MSATVSACLSPEKYLCSFPNKISCIISESIPVTYFGDEEKRFFLTRENDIFAFRCDHNALNEKERNLTDSVSGSLIKLCKKHQTAQYKAVDCGLWTADSGPHLCEKTLLPT